MANEATLLVRMEDPVGMICADGTGIEKGTLLRLTNSGTVVASSGPYQVFGGIAAAEKIASDGRTSIPVFLRGIFRVYLAANSTCQTGDLLILSGTNVVVRLKDFDQTTGQVAAVYSGLIVGKSLGTGVSSGFVPCLVGGI